MNRKAFLALLSNLRVNREPPVKPYKAILLAAVVTLIHKGVQTTPEILLDGALRSGFFQIFDRLYPRWKLKTRPKPYDPFRALATDGVWTLVPKPTTTEKLRANLGAGIWNVMADIQCARMDEQIFRLLQTDLAYRTDVLDVLARTYLPPGALKELLRLQGPDAPTVRAQGSLSERAVEEALERRWQQTSLATAEGVRLADYAVDHIQHRQVMTEMNCIDLLGYQERARTWWVFELKYQDPSSAAVAQALRYMNFIRKQHAKRVEEVVGAVLTDVVEPKLTAAAEEGRVQVWTYDVAALVQDVPVLHRVA